MSNLKLSETVTTIPEAQIGDMIAAGPWEKALGDILLGCVLRNSPTPQFAERRKVQTAETLIFVPTDISLRSSALEMSIVVAHDKPKGFFGRRKQTYWIFGCQNRSGEHCPISRHSSIGEAVQIMTEIMKAILAAQGKGIL